MREKKGRNREGAEEEEEIEKNKDSFYGNHHLKSCLAGSQSSIVGFAIVQCLATRFLSNEKT